MLGPSRPTCFKMKNETVTSGCRTVVPRGRLKVFVKIGKICEGDDTYYNTVDKVKTIKDVGDKTTEDVQDNYNSIEVCPPHPQSFCASLTYVIDLDLDLSPTFPIDLCLSPVYLIDLILSPSSSIVLTLSPASSIALMLSPASSIALMLSPSSPIGLIMSLASSIALAFSPHPQSL